MLLLAALALLFEPPRGERVTSEIVVQSKALRSTRTALDGVAPSSSSMKDPIARFTDPICVASSGLPADADHAIVDRAEAVAASAGLRIGSPGCTPNVFILFVPDGRAAVRHLVDVGSPGIQGQSVHDIRRILAEPDPARAWIETEIRSRDGDRPTYYSDKAPGLAISTASAYSLPIRRDILSSTVIIDRDAAAGLRLQQVADYAVVRALTGARPDGRLGRRSVLSLFTDHGQGSPEGATAFDRGYLRGLYEGRADLPDMIKRAAIVRRIASLENAGRP